MRLDLNGKKALVTGGSGDIGRAICRLLAASGADVAFAYFSDHEGAEATAKELQQGQGRPPEVFRVNFGDTSSSEAFSRRASSGGRSSSPRATFSGPWT
jgi:NAD(P)-dependent dehydrogenase (short-subunit alcohol dehydrogenase family)